jgi:hypothetical protein
MFPRRMAIAALLLAVTAAPAHAWLPRWTTAGWWQYNLARQQQLAGGQIVGGIQFGWLPQGAAMSAAQWQQLVTAQQQQMLGLNAAQWQPLVAPPGGQPAGTLPKSLQPAINPFATAPPKPPPAKPPPQPNPPPAPGPDGK